MSLVWRLLLVQTFNTFAKECGAKLTLRAIRSRPVPLADALARLQVVGSVLGTAGQALIHLLVDRSTVLALPARLAVALAGDTGAVSGAEWIQAVVCIDSRVAVG